MISSAAAHPVIPVSDIEQTHHFYGDLLGLTVLYEDERSIVFESADTQLVCIISEDAGHLHHTLCDFEVDDIDQEVLELREAGVKFLGRAEQDMETDGLGIADMGWARCAWICDPDGNIIALTQLALVPA